MKKRIDKVKNQNIFLIMACFFSLWMLEDVIWKVFINETRNLGSSSIILQRVVSWCGIFNCTQGFYNDNQQKLKKDLT